MIKKFDFPYSYYQDNVVNMEKELNRLKKTTDNSNKKIALYLFLLQLKCIEQGITEENFFEFSPWLAYDPNTIDVEMIEANLRVTSNSQKGFYIDTIEEFTKSDTETIAHILYILTTCFTFGDLQAVVNRYPDNNKYSKDIRQVLDILNIESLDRNSLPRVIERINETSDRWVWKNFLLGFFYYQKAFWHNEKSVKQKAIAALKKVVHLSKDKRLLYVSYLFLGYLYEHNKNCIRFGRGFSLNAAINAYKKAIEINPDSIPAHLNLYTLFFLKVEPKKAWYHLMRIKKINPQYARENFCFKEGFYSKIVKFKKSKQVELLRKCSLNEEQRHILDLIFSVKYNRDFVNKNFK
ncbi:tetratricopeptide repeat protein [bacterium]|nr:tetratricopeptide repeat protein [bacterium]